MKKSIFGRKFKRDKDEREALFKGLMSSLILKERITTSEAKAKAIKPEIEKLVTKAKDLTNSSSKKISSSIYPNAYEKFVKDTALRFKDRNGGYTRIIKIGKRLGDKSPMVVLEWVEMTKAVVAPVSSPKPKVKKAAVKKTVTKKVSTKKVTKSSKTK
jgi:large subunit ribosomal protein L17